MPTVTVGPHRVWFQQQGRDRPAVLLVHGAGGSSRCYDVVLKAIGRRYRAVALDLPGHGNTRGPMVTSEKLLDQYCEVVAAFAERIGLGRFLLGGHSMGGAVAQLLARRDPRRIAALVLIATGARLPIADEFFEVLEARPGTLGQWLARVAYSPATSRRLARSDARHWVAQSPRSSWLADLEACRTFDLRGELGGLECRTTVIGGADDRLTSPGMLEALASEIPRAQLHLLSRAGHQLIGERPDRVAQLVAQAVG